MSGSSIRSILDLGMKLHVPYNNDFALIEAITPHARYIRSLYLPCNYQHLSSGRFGGTISGRNWLSYDREVAELVRRLRPLGIEVNMLFNATYIAPTVLRTFSSSPMREYLDHMVEVGVGWVTVANIELAKQIRRYFPELKIDVSVLGFIDTVRRAHYWQDRVAPDLICIDLDQGRNRKLIQDVTEATGRPVKVLVNSFCLPDCPYKSEHYVHNSLRETSPFDCWTERTRRPWTFYRGRIVPPYYLRLYEGLVSDVKITDRAAPTRVIERLIRYYAEELDSKHYVPDRAVVSEPSGRRRIGNNVQRLYYEFNIKHPWLRELPEKVFEQTGSCDRDCHRCQLCYLTWKKEWQVRDDFERLQAFIQRVTDNDRDRRYYEGLLDALHRQRHNLPFVRYLHRVLAYCAPALKDLCHYYLGLSYLEAREDELADTYIARVQDPSLRDAVQAHRRSLREAPVIRYLDFDEEDPGTFYYLAGLRASRGEAERAALATAYLNLGEPELALPQIDALDPDPDLEERFIEAAFRNKLYALAVTLLERKDAAARDVRDHLRLAFALFKRGRPWQKILHRARLSARQGVALEPLLQYCLLALSNAAEPPQRWKGSLETFVHLAQQLEADHDLQLAGEVLEAVLARDPAHVTALRWYHALLLQMNRTVEAQVVEERIETVRGPYTVSLAQAREIRNLRERHFGLSEIYFAMRDYEAAGRHARQAVEAEGQFVPGWLRLLDCLTRINAQEELAYTIPEYLTALARFDRSFPRIPHPEKPPNRDPRGSQKRPG